MVSIIVFHNAPWTIKFEMARDDDDDVGDDENDDDDDDGDDGDDDDDNADDGAWGLLASPSEPSRFPQQLSFIDTGHVLNFFIRKPSVT